MTKSSTLAGDLKKQCFGAAVSHTFSRLFHSAIKWTVRAAQLVQLLHRWRCSHRCWRSSIAVHQIFQLFAGLKERNLFSRDFHAVSGLGIAADAGLSLAGAEAAKATDLDFIPRPQRANDAVENSFDDHFAVFTGNFRQTGNLINQIRFCHFCYSPLVLVWTGRAL